MRVRLRSARFRHEPRPDAAHCRGQANSPSRRFTAGRFGSDGVSKAVAPVLFEIGAFNCASKH
jgi:hypothetical protein